MEPTYQIPETPKEHGAWDEIWKKVKDKTPEKLDPGFKPKGTGANITPKTNTAWDEIWERIKGKTPEERDPGFKPKGTGAGEFAPGQQGAPGKGNDLFDDALRRIKEENLQGGGQGTPWGRKQPGPEPGFLKGGTPQEQERGLQSGGAVPRRRGLIGNTASSAPYFGAAAGGQVNNDDPFLRGGKTQGMRNGRGSYDDDVAELEELFRRAAEDAKKSMKPGSEGKIAEAIWREMNGEAGEVKKDWGESAQNGMEMVYNEGKQNNIISMSNVIGTRQEGNSAPDIAELNDDNQIPLTSEVAKEQENKDSVKQKIDDVFKNEPGAWFVVNAPFWINKDWAGKIIAGHWASGSGEDIIIDHDEDWTEYVKTDPYIATSTKYIVEVQCRDMKPGESRKIDFSGHTSFEGGSDLTGKNLLGGSNRNAGDYIISGTATMDENGNIITNLECQFNDRIDPNEKLDKERVSMVKGFPGMDPKDYNISISWNDQSVISVDGGAGDGWLGQDGLGNQRIFENKI